MSQARLPTLPDAAMRQARVAVAPDIKRHLAQRRAVAALQARQRVILATRTFGAGRPVRNRVLVAGQYYDVDDWRLAQLRAGLSPADLELVPVADEAE